MQDWAIIKEAKDEIKKLKEENKKLRDAVEFYADIRNWEFTKFTEDYVTEYKGTIRSDYEFKSRSFGRAGKLARETLAKIKGR